MIRIILRSVCLLRSPFDPMNQLFKTLLGFAIFSMGIVSSNNIQANEEEDASQEESPGVAFSALEEGAIHMSPGPNGTLGAYVPIRWEEGVRKTDIAQPSVAYVVYRGQVLELLGKAFENITFERDGIDQPALIRLFAPLDAFPSTNQVGDYKVVIDAHSAGVTRPPIVLSLSYPATVVSLPEKVSVNHTSGIPLVAPTKTEQTTLVLSQTDGLPVTGEALRLQVLWSEARGGKVEWTGAALEQGNGFQYTAAIKKRFPIGTHAGTLQVAGPGFSPKSVTIELKHHAHPIFLGMVVAIGILLGVVLRDQIQAYIDKRKVGVRVALFDFELERSLKKRQDESFLAAVNDFKRETADLARSIRNGTTPNGLTGAEETLSSIKDRFGTARDAFDSRLHTAVELLNDTIKAVGSERVLPTSVLDTYNLAQPVLLQLQTELMDGAGVDTVAVHLQRLFEQIERASKKWVQTFDQNRQHVETLTSGLVLPRHASVAWAGFLEVLAELKGEVPAITTESPASVGIALSAVEDRFDGTRHIVRRLHNDLCITGDRVIKVAKQSSIRPKSLDALVASVEAFKAEDPDVFPVADLVGRTGQLKNTISVLLGHLIAVIEEPHGTNIPAKVTAFLENGDYVLAANEMLKIRVKSAALSAAPDIPELGEELADEDVAEEESNGSSVVLEKDWTELSPEEKALIFQAEEDIKRAKIFQNSLSTVGLIALAYVIWLPGFTGSLQNLVAIGLWGFALDVGVGSLVDRVTDKISPA